MSTLTLDLSVPEKIVLQWNSLSEQERKTLKATVTENLTENLTALERVGNPPQVASDKFGYVISEEEMDEAEWADARAAIEEAIAESEAGLSIPFEQFVAEARARWKERGIIF